MPEPVADDENVDYTDPDGVIYRGAIVETIPSGSTIENERGRFRGVKYVIETDDGERIVTTTFADEPLQESEV